MSQPIGSSWPTTTARRLRAVTQTALALVACTTLTAHAPAALAQQSYSGEGAQACLECHESDTVMGIRETPHADFEDPRSPAAREQCESCHGPSATHMNFPMQVGNIVFTKHAKTPVAQRNQACLACHDEGDQAHWNEGAHGQELACATCHVMHKPRDPSLATSDQAKQCGECHTEILETAPDSAPHPLVGNDAIYCTQCHNPHGPTSLASCTDCHEQDAQTLAGQGPKAREYHERAIAREIACTSCHKGFVHAMPSFAEAGAEAHTAP